MAEHSIKDAAGNSLDDMNSALSSIIGPLTEGLEDCETTVPNLAFFRRESLTEPCTCLIEPSIVFVTQGAKQILIGDRAYVYDPGHFLVASLDLPASSQVLEASPEHPSLGLVFRLNLRVIAELATQVRVPLSADRVLDASAAIGTMTPALLEPFVRLAGLIAAPDDIEVLAPMIEREIHYRLLQTDLAPRLMQIVSAGSQSHRISRAIDWLKLNFARQLRVDDLAAEVNMSASSLHHHFRQLTAMSPLQYQKWLRLNEARRLMLNEHLDAAGAAFAVGYESPSQFSREYARLLGAPPRRDIEGMRGRGTPAPGQLHA